MKKYGVAIDIGTTTLTAGLIELATANEAAVFVDTNPQTKFGEDVISRLDYCIKHKTGLRQMHDAIISGINTAVAKIAKEAGIEIQSIEKLVVVGNTVMEHFFLRVPADSLAGAPYASGLQKGIIDTTADKVGLSLNKDVKVYLLPIVKSFVGSDLTAGVLYADLFGKSGMNILVDIGTNGEMALVSDKKFLVTSTAAGPAFEISDKGILGSEIIDIVSSLLAGGVIDKTGKLKTENEKITQNDIRRIQVAKAAIMAGMIALVNKAGLRFEDIENLYVSGKFGNLINKSAAIKIRLLPDIDKSRIKFIGNSAYKGAVLALCSESAMRKTEEIAEKAIHLSLFGRKDFQDEFVKNMSF